MHNITALLFVITALFFILSLRGLSSPKSAISGMYFGIAGMLIAMLTAVFLMEEKGLKIVFLLLSMSLGAVPGVIIARKIAMTSMPQLVAAFHSLVGLAAVFTSWAMFVSPSSFSIAKNGIINSGSLFELSLGLIIGSITFTASVIAFLKLNGNMSGKPIILPFRHIVNIGLLILMVVLLFINQSNNGNVELFTILTIIALVFGILIIVPIGGADMPVIVSMLNSYSGWAACGIGLSLGNSALIITGALVGSSGAILSYIMCKGMNRSFFSVIIGGFGGETSQSGDDDDDGKVAKQGSASDATFTLANASSVIIVPGYGLAVARAQHALKEMADILESQNITVKYAIHPVAGRMPGHMNVLLAEAQIDYENIFELDEINSEFSLTDVVFIVGANDITNPSAKSDKSSPIYGMPVLDVDKANTVLFVKRSMASGYAGIKNPLFFNDKTTMLFGDAKDMCEKIVKELKAN